MYTIGIIPLSGTTSEQHMLEDIAIFDTSNSNGELSIKFTEDEINSMYNLLISIKNLK